MVKSNQGRHKTHNELPIYRLGVNLLTLGQKHAQDEKKSSLESNMFSDCIGHPALEMLKI